VGSVVGGNECVCERGIMYDSVEIFEEICGYNFDVCMWVYTLKHVFYEDA
jgi:hypothetical protein